jgi:hypothetical protein
MKNEIPPRISSAPTAIPIAPEPLSELPPVALVELFVAAGCVELVVATGAAGGKPDSGLVVAPL